MSAGRGLTGPEDGITHSEFLMVALLGGTVGTNHVSQAPAGKKPALSSEMAPPPRA